jgi:hypothetical protein
MLKEVKVFTIVCDSCGKDVNEGSEFSGWDDESYTEEIRMDARWEKVDDNHYCTDCFEYDDNDELYIYKKDK